LSAGLRSAAPAGLPRSSATGETVASNVNAAGYFIARSPLKGQEQNVPSNRTLQFVSSLWENLANRCCKRATFCAVDLPNSNHFVATRETPKLEPRRQHRPSGEGASGNGAIGVLHAIRANPRGRTHFGKRTKIRYEDLVGKPLDSQSSLASFFESRVGVPVEEFYTVSNNPTEAMETTGDARVDLVGRHRHAAKTV
jgi:hypothetical protein